jgi:hypothetical protein
MKENVVLMAAGRQLITIRSQSKGLPELEDPKLLIRWCALRDSNSRPSGS